jgi:hypothetical protein
MSTSEENTKGRSPQSTPENPQGSQGSQGTGTPRRTEIPDLTEQIKDLIGKLDAPKRKSVWDIFPVLTTFMGTVVLAGISLYVTQSYQKQEAQRTHDYQAAESARVAQFNQAQIETQRAQIRVEELKALTSLAPLLASHDPAARATARQLLQAVSATAPSNLAAAIPTVGTLSAGSTGAGNPSAARTGTAERGNLTSVTADPTIRTARSSASLFDQFAAIALSAEASPQDRVAATRKIGEIATARTTSPALRNRAANVAVQIASSAEAPPEVKQAAADVIAKIKRVTPDEVVQMIYSQPLKRKITEVILHHDTLPASEYKGAQTIFGIANTQLTNLGYVGWHYAIAADGAIWVGVPLNDPATNTSGHNKTSVAVMLLMDGDKELPTDAQRASLVVVLKALFSRFKLDASANSPDGSGFHFHRDYTPGKTCPGRLLTKEMVLGWR